MRPQPVAVLQAEAVTRQLAAGAAAVDVVPGCLWPVDPAAGPAQAEQELAQVVPAATVH